MPNLKPPVTHRGAGRSPIATASERVAPDGSSFLSADDAVPDRQRSRAAEIDRAKHAGVVAVKLYPAGAMAFALIPSKHSGHRRGAHNARRSCAASGCFRHCLSSNVAGTRLSLRFAESTLSSSPHPALRLSWHIASLCRLPVSQLKGIARDATNIITLHLGNGCSIAAIKSGDSIHTSMGFTPLEGLVMGTRSGDFDASIVDLIATKEGLSSREVETLLNKQSGLLGISGLTDDMRDLLAEAHEHDDRRARLAMRSSATARVNISGVIWPL